MTASCVRCGRIFQAGRSTQRFCSASCRKQQWEQENPRRQKSGAAKRARYGYEKRAIIGLDGEGFDNPPRYVMLLASNGEGISDPNGLTTEACLEFLVSLPRSALKWGYGFAYDVNMILGSWPHHILIRLWNSISTPGGTCSVRYGRWWIKWIPGKQFIVMDLNTRRTCCIWDVLPFVQQSFVEWLESGELAPVHVIDRIREMKVRRSAFDEASLDEIETYCRNEVQYLEAGVRQMLELFTSADLKPASYFGAGSLASALMRKHHVREFIAPPPDEYVELIKVGFRGGRFENAFVGWEDEAWAADLNSAYADGCRNLPCLKCAQWKAVERPPRTEHAIVRVVWDLGDPDITRWGPFPVKTPGGPLSYPAGGESWCWTEEVRAAQRVWPGRIRVLEAVELHISCDHEPFAYVPGVYEERRRLKAEGDPREKILKMALSASYGKLAQQVGDPPVQSLAWAGMITAHCRGQILDTMRPDPDNVRMIATDGLLVREIPDHLVVGEGLGEWEVKRVADVLALQPGLYFYRTEDGEKHTRSRGFGRADLTFEKAAQAIDRDIRPSLGTLMTRSLNVRTRRFRGLGSVVRQKAWSQWRRWIEQKRSISLNPWPRRGALKFEKGCVETYAIGEAKERKKQSKHPNYRWDAEREAEREPTDGGSLW